MIDMVSTAVLAEQLNVSRLTVVRTCDRLELSPARIFGNRLLSADEAERVASRIRADRAARETRMSGTAESGQ